MELVPVNTEMVNDCMFCTVQAKIFQKIKYITISQNQDHYKQMKAKNKIVRAK